MVFHIVSSRDGSVDQCAYQMYEVCVHGSCRPMLGIILLHDVVFTLRYRKRYKISEKSDVFPQTNSAHTKCSGGVSIRNS